MALPDRFNDRKLREEALKAFVKALHTDRMIAVTGSMSTRALGYTNWKEFIGAYGLIACDLAVAIYRERREVDGGLFGRPAGTLLRQIAKQGKALARGCEENDPDHKDTDHRVAMWALHDSFRAVDRMMHQRRSGLVINNVYQPPALEEFERRIATLFTSRSDGMIDIGTTDDTASGPREAAIRPLLESLGIRRFATLNYDLELERALMLRDDERDIMRSAETPTSGGPPPGDIRAKLRILANKAKRASRYDRGDNEKALEAYRDERRAAQKRSVEFFIGDPDSGKPIVRRHRNQLVRTMGNGVEVTSDVVDRERPDRLFEFAIGASDIGGQIIHLHGRADAPDSIIANLRQYNRQYRLDDLNRDPFDYGLRVLFGGNPALFVGVGMTEPELNLHLEYFVSNLPIRRPAPAFVIWNTNDIAESKRAAYMAEKRLDFHARLGVHLLFDVDIIQPGAEAWLEALKIEKPDEVAPALPPAADSAAKDRLAAFTAATRELGAMMAQVLGPNTPDHWAEARRRVRAIEDDLAIAERAAAAPPPVTVKPATKPSPEEREAKRLKALAVTLGKLPALVSRVDRRLQRGGKPGRSITARLENSEGPFRLYGAKNLSMSVGAELKKQEAAGLTPPDMLVWPPQPGAKTFKDAPTNVIFASAPAGSGRGAMGELLVQMPDGAGASIGGAIIQPTRRCDRLMVNAGFSYDSDTMLVGIAAFLLRRTARQGLPHARESLFADGSLFLTSPALVVINGVDRFFSMEGVPLSAELDHMLRCALRWKGQVQFVLLGTDRLKRYGETIGVPIHSPVPAALPAPRREPAPSGAPPLPPTRLEEAVARGLDLRSSYLNWIAASFAQRRAKILYGTLPIRRRGKHRHHPEQLDISAAGIALIERAVEFERDSLPRAFFEAYLSPPLLQALGLNCAAAFEVLRTMCFIGGPVEAAVLLHAPKVRAILAENPDAEKPGTEVRPDKELPDELIKTVEALEALGLLVPLDPHEPEPEGIKDSDFAICSALGPARMRALWQRYGLHRSLATVLRDRYGAPINDAKLATTFNMSLFMSEPSDNYTPQPDFHEELADLVDHLIGAWHDVDQLYQPDAILKDDRLASKATTLEELYIANQDREHAIQSIRRRSGRIAAACFRSALSLVRNYYSTGALLKLDREDRVITPERDGALTEHAHRLDRLITAYGDISVARQIMRERCAAAADYATPERLPVETKRRMLPAIWETLCHLHMGPDPLYPDDLVWLHNERGVVALTQGHMFDARDAFSAAHTVNDTYVEQGYRGHNWRRISINRIAARIERGMLQPAEKLLDQVEESVNNPLWCDCNPRHPGRVQRIRQMAGDMRAATASPADTQDWGSSMAGAHGLGAHVSSQSLCGGRDYTREEMVVVGMATGYRGLIAHMRGQYISGGEYYAIAVELLRRLGEHRALAHFQRHFAALQSFVGEKALALREIELAINSAQSAKQMDILHRARVVRANLWRHVHSDPVIRRQALQDVKDALKYAAHSDCYRVRIEASASLARHMRESGDYDTALRYATDALMIASRYGHSLQKTAQRIEIGQILKARGDPLSGDAMLDRAIAIGTNKGYHLALALERVRSARNVLAANPPLPNRTDIPIAR